MNKQLSIIIPVYNGKRHLRRCVDSVLSQKHFPRDQLDIILLDDGSRDSSFDIMQDYEHAHPECVRALQHPNMGVAETRNRGIREARGTYVMFIDQDDWIDKDYCHTYHTAIESTGADVVYGGYRRPDATGRRGRPMLPSDSFYSRYIITAAWAKIHRRELLIRASITFFNNKFGEDSVFTIKEISATDKWHRLDYVGYNWFHNESSVSNTAQRSMSEQDTLQLMVLLEELLGAAGENRHTYEMRYYLLRTITFYLLFSGRHGRPEDFIRSHHAFFHWYRTNCGNLSWGQLLGPKGETLTARLAILVMAAIERFNLAHGFARILSRPPGRSV